MSTVTGIVQKVEKMQRGQWEMADIYVAGQKYGAGPAKFLKAKEGDYVQFESEQNGNFLNVVRNSLKVSKNKPPAEALEEAKKTSSNVSQAVKGFDNRQDIISRQSASNTAVAYMQVLQAADAIAVPAGKAKSKGGIMEYYDTLLAEYTKFFFESNTGQEWKDIRPSAKSEEEDEAPFEEGPSAPADDEWE